MSYVVLPQFPLPRLFKTWLSLTTSLCCSFKTLLLCQHGVKHSWVLERDMKWPFNIKKLQLFEVKSMKDGKDGISGVWVK